MTLIPIHPRHLINHIQAYARLIQVAKLLIKFTLKILSKKNSR